MSFQRNMSREMCYHSSATKQKQSSCSNRNRRYESEGCHALSVAVAPDLPATLHIPLQCPPSNYLLYQCCWHSFSQSECGELLNDRLLVLPLPLHLRRTWARSWPVQSVAPDEGQDRIERLPRTQPLGCCCWGRMCLSDGSAATRAFFLGWSYGIRARFRVQRERTRERERERESLPNQTSDSLLPACRWLREKL